MGDVVLRKPEPKDLEPLYAQKNDPEINAMLGGFSRGYARADLQGWIEFHRNARDEVLYAIADVHTDACLGHVGLYKIDHRIGAAEFAILLGERSAWGRGIGCALTRFMVGYAFDWLNLQRVYLEVLDTNERATRLYRRLGFVEEGRLRRHQFKAGKHVDVLVMGLLRDEWRRDP